MGFRLPVFLSHVSGQSIWRLSDSHIDFALQSPSPRETNEGSQAMVPAEQMVAPIAECEENHPQDLLFPNTHEEAVSAGTQTHDLLPFLDDCPVKNMFSTLCTEDETNLFNNYYDFPHNLMLGSTAHSTPTAPASFHRDRNMSLPTHRLSQAQQPIESSSQSMPSPSIYNSGYIPSQFSPNFNTLPKFGKDALPAIPIQTVQNQQLEKRRAQNRNSQRAFRERKESYTKYLEQELLQLQEKYDALLKCLYKLRAAYRAIDNVECFDTAWGQRWTGRIAEEGGELG